MHLQMHTRMLPPSLEFPFPLSGAASGVWARIDGAYFFFDRVIPRLILSFIAQDTTGWLAGGLWRRSTVRRLLLPPTTKSPALHPRYFFAGTAGALQV